MTCDLVTNRFLEFSYEESLFFPDKSTAPMLCFLTFINNLLQGQYLFPTSWELVSTSWVISFITLCKLNTFFHFKGTSCFLFLGNDMCPSHQPILELSFEECLLFPHESTAPMIYIFSPLKITFYQVNTSFPILGNSFLPPGQSQLLPYAR